MLPLSSLASGDIPGYVLLVIKHGEQWIHADGLRDVANQQPMTSDTIFRIYSMTKPITSVAVMMLIEEGRLDLDDPVDQYLPQFANREVATTIDRVSCRVSTSPAQSRLRIRHLLTNTSGIGYRYLNETVYLLQKQFGQTETALPLAHEPGTRWTYGASTKVLGEIIAKISGLSLDEFLARRILEPLGMHDTFFRVPEDKTARVATTHQRTNGRLIEKPNPTPLEVWSRGDYGLYSTASDYSQFVQMLMRGGVTPSGERLLRDETVRAMTTNQIGELVVERQPSLNAELCGEFPSLRGSDKFGFGFHIVMPQDTQGGRRPAGSYGWSGVMNTFFWVDPINEVSLILLTQILPSHDPAVLAMLDAAENALYREGDLLERRFVGDEGDLGD